MGTKGPIRCAVTSRDGVSVNQRFARATDFLVFEGGADGVRFVERRPRPPGDARSPEHREAVARLLEDCPVLASLQFPGADRRCLSGKGFALHEVRGPIEVVIGEILSQDRTRPGTTRPGTAEDAGSPKEPAR